METRRHLRIFAILSGLALQGFTLSGVQAAPNAATGRESRGTDPTQMLGAPSLGDILICDLTGVVGLAAFTPGVNTTQSLSAGGQLTTPMGVAIESSGSALVSVLGKGIVRVNLVTGTQQVVSSGGLFINPDGIALGLDGKLYVADLGNNSIIAVNTSTGAQQLISSGQLLNGPIFLTPVGNDLLVSSHGNARLVWVNIATGAQTVAASGGFLTGPEGLAIDPSGKAIVVDLESRRLLSIDLQSGAQQVITSALGGTPMGLALDGMGHAYIGNYQAGSTNLLQVDLVTGVKTSLPTLPMHAFGMAAMLGPLPPPPQTPATLDASDDQPDGVHLVWRSSVTATSYRVYRNNVSIGGVGAPETTYVDSPAIGTYTYCVEAVNFGGASGQICESGSRRAYRIMPEIHFVKDVPNDQGGKLAIAWLRSEYDNPIDHTITSYRIWRRLPVSDGAAIAGPIGEQSTETRTIIDGQSITYWEPLGTIPAAFLEGYGVVEPSTQDSLPDANPYAAFFVSALTSNPFVFYDSAIDSGYSVDNLAPAPPAGLHGTIASGVGITLHWMPNREADLAFYAIYLGPAADFVPSPDNQLGSTADTIFAAGTASGSFYKVSAVDMHGNASAFSTLAFSELPTTTLVTDIEAEAEGASVRVTVGVSSAAANLSAILYRGVSGDFSAARPVPNASGSVTAQRVELRDVTVAAGSSYWYWVQLVGSDGLVVLAGPVSVSVGSAPAFTALRTPEPNPMVNLTTLRFALGTDVAGSGSAPCRIEIFTVQGRKVRTLESSVRVAGTYETQWDGKDDLGAPLRGGVYYVRLSVASLRKTCKVVLAR